MLACMRGVRVEKQAALPQLPGKQGSVVAEWVLHVLERGGGIGGERESEREMDEHRN